jgi:hypothetical protein
MFTVLCKHTAILARKATTQFELHNETRPRTPTKSTRLTSVPEKLRNTHGDVISMTQLPASNYGNAPDGTGPI